MKKLIEFCVKNSLLVNLLTLFIVVFGLYLCFTIRKEAFPNISYDFVTVQTNYPGASAREIEKHISIKLEDEIQEVDGIRDMLSISSESISMIVIRIQPDEKNKTKVVNDIQRAVDRVNDLPADLEDDPIVTEMESKNFPVINVSLSGNVDEKTLREYARQLEDRFLDMPEVAKVSRIGWREQEIWVEVAPEKVDSYHISLEEIMTAIRLKNRNLPAGNLDTENDGEFLVRTVGEFETAQEIKDIVVRANDLGNWIRVQDVAAVSETFEENRLIEKTFGNRAITLTVIKRESADIIKTVNEVKRVSEEFKKGLPPEIRVSFFDDLSFYVKRRLNVLLSNGWQGFLMVIIALLLLLRADAAFNAALGVPVSILATVIIMHAFGMTINLITMFALIMVLGILVDDAIVIAENVFRYREKGYSRQEAAILGTNEVAIPVIAAILTNIVAFIPIFFMKGIMGKFCFPIPVIVIVTMLSSVVEALFVLPSHLVDFSFKKDPDHRKKNLLDRSFQKFRIFYLKTLRLFVRFRYMAFLLSAGMVFCAGFLFKTQMHYIAFPEGLIEEFFIRTETSINTSLKKNAEKMGKIETLLQNLPQAELENFITQVGIIQEDISDPSSQRGNHLGQIHVFLTPEKSRMRTADEIIDALRGQIKNFEHEFKRITFEKLKAGPPVGKPVSLRVRGNSFEAMEKAAILLKKELAQITGVSDIRDDLESGKNELRILVKAEDAKKAGLSVDIISQTVRNAIDGGIATTIQKTDEEIDVLVRYPESWTRTQKIFDNIYIPNSFGKLIPLKKVAEIKTAPGLHAIKRLDRKRMIGITASLNEKVISPLEIQKKIDAFYEKEIRGKHNVLLTYGGEQEESQQDMQGFLRAFLLAIFLNFIILAVTFRSIIQPLVVMCSIPYGIVGVIFALYLHQQPLSFMSMMGLIGLSGVVVNDSIVLIDRINQNLLRGDSINLAIFEAGRTRLRAMTLTSTTTVFGLLPLAYGLGGSDPFIKPMALAMGWGLFFATFLNVLVIPGTYAIVTSWKNRFRKPFKKAAA